jgi:hypothetical protein
VFVTALISAVLPFFASIAGLIGEPRTPTGPRPGRRRRGALRAPPNPRPTPHPPPPLVRPPHPNLAPRPHSKTSPPARTPGAISFWPTIVYAPIEMYLRIRKPRPAAAAALRAVNWGFFVLALGAFVGSVYDFVEASKSFRPFGL